MASSDLIDPRQRFGFIASVSSEFVQTPQRMGWSGIYTRRLSARDANQRLAGFFFVICKRAEALLQPSAGVGSKCQALLSASEMTERCNAQKIDDDSDDVPYDDGPRRDQQAIVDPHDLKHTHDCGHARVHPGTRPTSEHREQIRHRSEGSSKTSNEPDNFGTLEPGRQQARSITGHQVLTTNKCQHA